MDSQLTRRSQRNHTTILQAIAKVGQGRIAELIGKSPSTITVFKDEYLQRLAEVLAACGLKTVNDTDESVDLDEVRALRVLAVKRIQERLIDAPESGFGNL